MNTKDSRKKLKRIVRFIAGGAFLMAIAGLIVYSPLSAGEERSGPRHLGISTSDHIAFLEIVLDLTASQVDEIEPILDEQHEKMAELRDRYGMRGRGAERMRRMHRNDCCDNVDRTEMRANMRRQQREREKTRDEMRGRIERNREEFEERLAGVLDEGQMNKFRELRELREDRREERRERRGGRI